MLVERLRVCGAQGFALPSNANTNQCENIGSPFINAHRVNVGSEVVLWSKQAKRSSYRPRIQRPSTLLSLLLLLVLQILLLLLLLLKHELFFALPLIQFVIILLLYKITCLTFCLFIYVRSFLITLLFLHMVNYVYACVNYDCVSTYLTFKRVYHVCCLNCNLYKTGRFIKNH